MTTTVDPAAARERTGEEPHLLDVRDLVMNFPIRGGGLLRRTVGYVHAVSGVSFSLDAGETLGVVGESGCGKSTTGRAVLQLHKPTSGSVKFDGRELTTLSTDQMRAVRRDLQIVSDSGHRGVNGQPGGRLISDGGAPVIGVSRS